MTLLDPSPTTTSWQQDDSGLMLLGQQRPRLEHRPEGVVSSALALETCELSAEFGLVLDEWQAYDLSVAMGIRSDGLWAASEVGVDCPRQNGKGGILEARHVSGLFLLEEPLQVHTTHVFTTTQEHFLRLRNLIEGGPEEYSRRAKFRVTNGQMEIAVRNTRGRVSRLRFLARKGGSGRGFSGDTIYLDEAMEIRAGVMASLRYTMRARPNPQLWLTASAPLGTPASADWRTTIRQAERGSEPRLAFCGHSIDPAEAPEKDVSDREVIRLAAVANPSLGSRITHETVLAEFRKARDSTDPDTWREWMRETLGLADPDPYEAAERVIDMAAWALRADHHGKPEGRAVLGVAVSPNRKWAAVGMAAKRAGGGWLGVNLDHRPGTHWVTERVLELVAAQDIAKVVLDERGPAGSMAKEFADAGIDADLVQSETTKGYSQACGLLHDLVIADIDAGGGFWHRNQLELTDQLDSAERKWTTDAWLWRRSDEGDITVLEAVTLALGVAVGLPEPEDDEVRVVAFSA